MEKKLKIVFLGNAASIHTIKWARFFAEKGHEVHLLSYDKPREDEIGNINVHILKKKIPIKMWPFNTLANLPFTVRKVRKIVKKIRPDIVNAHYVTSYGHLGVLTGVRPLVVTAWGSDILITPEKHLLAKMIVKSVLKKADLITCDADHMKKAMEKLGADSQKIKIINFGIDTNKFKADPPKKEVKKKLGISEEEKVVISLRRLEPICDVESLVRAVPVILKNVPDTKFVIAGEGAQKKYLENLSKKLGVMEKVSFIGRVKNDDLVDYFNVSSVYVSTSLSDAGISASTAEAMATGKSVVVTDSGENKEWIKDGENGFIVPVKSPRKLAEKVQILLRNKELRKRFGNKAREIVLQRNDYYNEMTKMEKIYKELVLYGK